MKTTFNKQEIILAYKKAQEGKLSNEQIEKNLKEFSESMLSFEHTSELITANRYEAQVQVATIVGWVWINASVTGSRGKSTQGNGGGVFLPGGGGGYWGYVNTDSLEMMYRDTISFAIHLTNYSCIIVFFDAHSRPLGSFEGVGIGTSNGMGGGKLSGWQ